MGGGRREGMEGERRTGEEEMERKKKERKRAMEGEKKDTEKWRYLDKQNIYLSLLV